MWAHLGAMLAHLGAMLAHLEAMLAHLGAMLAHLGPMLAYLGAMLALRPGALGVRSWPCPCRTAVLSSLKEGPPPLPPTTPHHPASPKYPAFCRVFCCSHFFNHFSDLAAQDGSTWGSIGPKIGQHSLKMGQHNP